LIAYIDGGARGNPGPAGFGVRIEREDGSLVEEFSEAIGVATNNVAEYRGLIAALEWARRHGARELHVRSDSLLLVQQMRGAFKVKNAGLQPLYGRARVLVHDIGRVTFEHVGRALNCADRLANGAWDEGGVTSPQSPAAVHGRRSLKHPFSALRRAVRLHIYRKTIDTTRAPDAARSPRRSTRARRTSRRRFDGSWTLTR
jgi:ribonuclease HI